MPAWYGLWSRPARPQDGPGGGDFRDAGAWTDCGRGVPAPVPAEDVHHLGNDVLAEFKMLTNYRMDSSNRLCLLLVGLTELRNRLSMAVHEPLAQRIIVNCHIPALRHEEVGAYIEHRMRLAGADVPVFEPAAIEAVALASNRIPRQINRIAHNALIAAAADGSRTVTESHVNRAANEALL